MACHIGTEDAQQQHRWFSGRMLACHAGGPGSIPGRCNDLLVAQAIEHKDLSRSPRYQVATIHLHFLVSRKKKCDIFKNANFLDFTTDLNEPHLLDIEKK